MWYCDACHRWHTRAVEVITADGRHICQRRWQQECPHEHTILVTSGGHHFSAGNVCDDIHEMVYCRVCGKRLPARFSQGKLSSQEDGHLEAAYEDRFEIPFGFIHPAAPGKHSRFPARCGASGKEEDHHEFDC